MFDLTYSTLALAKKKVWSGEKPVSLGTDRKEVMEFSNRFFMKP